MVLYYFHHSLTKAYKKVISCYFFRAFIITLVLEALEAENKNTYIFFRTLSLTYKHAIVSSGPQYFYL